MLVFGGSSPDHGAFSDVFVLHLDMTGSPSNSGERTYRWEQLSCSGEQPEARELHCGVRVSDNRVCFAGGRNRDGNMCTDMAWLDTTKLEWQIMPICGWGRCSYVAGSIRGTIVGFGGFDGSSVCGDCCSFCEKTEAWYTVEAADDKHPHDKHQPIPERFGHCGTAVELFGAGDKAVEQAILVFGGMNAETDLDDVVMLRQR